MVNDKDYPNLVANYIKCVNLISSYRSNGTLNLEDKIWLTPSEILLLRETISEAKQKGKYKPPKDENVKGYLDFISTETGSKTQTPESSYIQFSRIDNNNVDSIASKMTGMIGNKLTKESLYALRYSIDELLANVREHSHYTNSFIMLQNYRSLKTLEFSLMDDGISIPVNFRKHGIDFQDDSDSLNKAISGVSTKVEEGGRGYGLHSVFNVLTLGMEGEGLLVSGRGILSTKFAPGGKQMVKKLFTYASNSADSNVFRGCYVAFRVRNDLSPDLYQYLE